MALDVNSQGQTKTWMPNFAQVFGAKSAEIEQSEIEALIAEEDSTAKARRDRHRALIVPREHGAWGLLLVPMVTGAGIALRESRDLFPFLLLLTAAISLFWLRTPLESYLGTSAVRAQTIEERRDVLFAVVYLAAVAALALAMLFREGANPLLWYLGSAAGAAFAAQALLRRLGRPVRMLSELIGTAGLTASAPAAYYVITGKFGTMAWLLWLANLLFAGNQIHYVQVRIHSARVGNLRDKLAKGWPFAVGQLLMLVILDVICLARLMPWIALIAYVPAFLRGWSYFFQKPSPLMVRRLGWSELALGVVFCILCVATI